LCAGGLEARMLKNGDPERLVCTTCGHVLYLDPKVAVGTIIRGRDDRIVLVRRAIEPGYGKWVFPGGYVDRGEPPEAAAIREAREEAGLEVRLEGLVNIYAYPSSTPIIIVYSAAVIGGSLCADDECLEVGWFGQADIPWGHLAFRSTHEGLRDYFEIGAKALGR
jgi:8-oxo-dGTP diphosphatase